MKLWTLAGCAIAVVAGMAFFVRMTPDEGAAQEPSASTITTPSREVNRSRSNSPRTSTTDASPSALPIAKPVDIAPTASPAQQTAASESQSPVFTVGNTEFFHRFTHENHHEFTPAGQSDLEAWTDMVTVIRHPNITSQSDLQGFASAMLNGFEKHGHIIRVDTFPATDDSPEQYFIVAVLGNPELLEAVFARFIIHDGVGTVIMYAHRVYGKQVGDEMGDWLRDNGPTREKHLMEWDTIPSYN